MKSEPLRLIVRADLFRAAARFQPDPAGAAAHPELAGVHVEPCEEGGAIIVAGDECGIIALRDPNGICSRPVTVQIPRETLALAKDVLKGRAHTDSRGHDAEDIRIAIRMAVWRGLRVAVQPASGVESDAIENHLPYPNWRALLPPAPQAGGHFAIGAEEAGRLALTAQTLAQAAGVGVETARKSPFALFHDPGSRRALVRFRHWDDAIAVVLPASTCGFRANSTPAWAFRADAVKATEAA